MKAKATNSTWYGADSPKDLGPFSGATPSALNSEYAGEWSWDTAPLSSNPETFAKNRTLNCWQLTMGRLSRSGNIYSYERTKDSVYSQVKRTYITFANYSYQRSQESKGEKKGHVWTEKKCREPEFNRKMTIYMNGAGTTSEALAVLKNRLHRGLTVDSYMYVDVLKRCSKQKDLLAAKQLQVPGLWSG
ncbi:unnamed protein product [Calypogeia fissa]